MTVITQNIQPANVQQEGAVEFRDWHHMPFADGAVRGITGKVSVHSTKELVGFDVNDRDSNWLVCVEGPSGFRSYIPGCQVAGIFYAPAGTGPIANLARDLVKVP